MNDRVDSSVADRVVEQHGGDPQSLIPVLLAVQQEVHYLPDELLRRVAELLGLPPARVAGVASFYGQFRRRPAGRHRVRVCVGTACHVKGGERVYEAFRRQLGIEGADDTDGEREFTVERVACLGCCMLAPVVQIDDVTYGFVSTEKVPRVLRDFLEAQSAEAGREDGGARRGGVEGEVRLCLCSSCVAAGAQDTWESLAEHVAGLGLHVKMKSVGCTGRSFEAPLVEVVAADGRRFRYGRIGPGETRSVLCRHFRPAGTAGRVRAAVSGLLDRMLESDRDEPVTRFVGQVRDDIAAGDDQGQVRLVTEWAGEMDPLDIDEYMERGGFEGLRRSMHEAGPEEIIAHITESGLMGRGGAGFATGQKWKHVREAPGADKVVVCNGDEGDPGAFMDRMILESFPYRVIEGMAIAGRAVGASEAVIYVRGEYPLAVQRVEQALEICRQRGLLGAGVLESNWRFDIRVMQGAGAFVCGEETALVAALEGRRGMPRYRPPYPSEAGLRGCPTVVNNVETFALVPWIMRTGGHAFSRLGTPGSTGTKTFALAGKVRRGGLVEVPMGMSLGEIVNNLGGGVPEGRTLKAVQIGGPSGGCVPASCMNMRVDYSALKSVGAMMGSGGLVVLDDEDCMVEVARYFLAFTQAESCGKCTFCRIGTRRLLRILTDLTQGRGSEEHLREMENLSASIKALSLCGLGKTAPNPVMSAWRHFRQEFEAHARGTCPAKRCKALIQYRITETCIGCTRCAQRCPVDAIELRPYRQHEIDPELCTRCDTCRAVCPVDAIVIEDVARTSDVENAEAGAGAA